MEGVGSIWNKNSWHWEEKNYTEKAKLFLTENLSKLEHEAFTPRASNIKITKVKDIKGSAVITIRKKKQMFLYDFEIELEWEATEREGDEEAKGTIKIFEFHQDDDDDDINLEIKADKETHYSDEARSAINSSTKSKIIKILEDFKDLMKQIDADEKKIRADGEKRMKEEEEMKKAVEDKGDEKAKIFDEIKQKESELRAQKEAVKQATNQVDDAAKGTGSVWNPNSYFWETKNLDKFSHEIINEHLANFVHTVPNGSLKVTKCEITGEASASIRKGKKITVFDYAIDLTWRVDLKGKLTQDLRILQLKLEYV
jgi:activator of HSP90 ATPase